MRKKREGPEKKRALAMSKMKESHAWSFGSGSESSELSKERRKKMSYDNVFSFLSLCLNEVIKR